VYNLGDSYPSAFDMQLYRQAVPAIGVSLERATENVPNDGFFYVLFKGEIKGRFRTRSRALALYRTLLNENGYKAPPVAASADASRENVERYLDDLETYWRDAHRHRRRGGKTMYRS
jgi:hypothetical protein